MTREELTEILGVSRFSATVILKNGIKRLDHQLKLQDYETGYTRDYNADIRRRMDYLRCKMDAYGIGIKELAQIIGVRSNTLSGYFTGVRGITVEVYEKIIEFLESLED